MTGKKKIGLLSLFIYLYLILISIAIPVGTLFYKQYFLSSKQDFSLSYFISNSVSFGITGFICGLILVVSLIYHELSGSYWFKAGSSLLITAILYSVALVMCGASVFVSPYVFPFVFLTVYIMVVSDSLSAIASCVSFSTLVMRLGDNNTSAFLYIFITSFLAVVIFGLFSKNLKYVSKSVIVTMISIVIYLGVVLVNCYSITPELILFPAIGMIINLLGMLFSLRSFVKRKIEAVDDEFNRINDPEFELLMELKEKNKKEYKVAIHTAYLSDRIADKLKKNRVNSKIIGYYHNIGVLDENKNSVEIGTDNHFPEEILSLLSEYDEIGRKYPQSGEVVICKMCDEVVRTIINVTSNDSNIKPDYNKIVHKIFKDRSDSGFFDKCNLTMNELSIMREHLQGEKLYYDFLR